MRSPSKTSTSIIALLFGLIPLNATVRLNRIFSDNMVIQRETPVHVWGKTAPGEKVQVEFAGVKRITFANSDSTWSVYFPKQKANVHPQTLMVVTQNDKIVLRNILIGDVWVCSGQSNMEWPMQREMHFKAELKQANQPLIRLSNPVPVGRYVYNVAFADSLNKRLTPRDFYRWESWQSCDSSTFRPMSAVAYYFAKSIVTRTGVPVGLINLSLGGAPIETFISYEVMAKSKQFAVKVRPGNWLENESLPEWTKIRGGQNVGMNPNGFKDDRGLNHGYKPGFAYEGGVKALLPFAVKGVIWYQGESNSLEKPRVEEYNDLFKLMVNDYRSGWENPEMPFYWVQLSSIDTATYHSQYWPEFRDGQRRLLNEIKNSGMAVCSDIGFKDNVHPTNKKDVGERLARWALKQTYGADVVPSGPLPVKACYKNGSIVVSLRFAEGFKTADGKALRGFSFDGKNEVPAAIENGRIIIPASVKPEYVYYGWKPFSDANLVNAENLPASTFKIKVQ